MLSQEDHRISHKPTAELPSRIRLSYKTNASGLMDGNSSIYTVNPEPTYYFAWISKSLFTLYLFTASDFISVLFPQTLFAIFSVLSNKFTVSHSQLEPQISIYYRILCAASWIWLQLLVLDLANQRLPDSVSEDKVNKPWRPITSGRITVEGTRQLLIASIAITFAVSHYMGATLEALLLFTLNWMYNDLGLANSNWFMRNVMNALGITSIGAGATRVACGDLVFKVAPAARWWLLCAGMLATTIHAQDLYDQEGDAVRGRSTVPLVCGDKIARWSVSAGVLFWSVMFPTCLNLHLREHWVGYAGPALLGMWFTVRVLTLGGASEDKRTFKVWALWTICIYSLPLLG
ncbi:UbiA prenyltransferase family-domain-containing protein [Nemania sp. FL0031]|nr:UbiA prenyltransferase family-domain-containing protein [Nemania sp. FL0031]